MLLITKNKLNKHRLNADLGYTNKTNDKELSKNNPELGQLFFI